MRRKGEIGPAQIRRDYPYRLLFPEEHARDLYQGSRFYRSSAPRTLVDMVNGERRLAVHFAEEADAKAFQRHAGGEFDAIPRRFPRPGEG